MDTSITRNSNQQQLKRLRATLELKLGLTNHTGGGDVMVCLGASRQRWLLLLFTMKHTAAADALGQ